MVKHCLGGGKWPLDENGVGRYNTPGPKISNYSRGAPNDPLIKKTPNDLFDV